MRVTVVTPPAPIVTWADANTHLKLDGDTSQQPYVSSLIAAATGHIDGPGGWLDRAIGVQTLEARLDNFDCGSIRLPFPEIVSVTSVKYLDGSGVEQTVAGNGYELLGPSLVPVYGATWPTPRWAREAIRIRYQAGYAPGAPQLAVAKAAILLMVGDLYRNRETTVAALSTTVEALLGPLQVYR